MHLDGARLWNASVAGGVPLREYARHFDSVMVCFSKGMGCPVGSVLVGDKAFVDQARRHRKMLGGGMRQAGLLAGAGLYALRHNIARMSDDHRRAKRLARAISSVPVLDIDLASVQTNIVVFDISRTGISPEQAEARLARRGLLVVTFGAASLRAVTHLDVGDGDVKRAGEILKQAFR
jgi:threonine aldolase